MGAERWLFLLMLVPTVTEFVENGQWPATLRELISEVVLTLCIGVLVWRLRQRFRQLLRLSETDSLTRLKNRRKFQVDLADEVRRAHRMDTALSLVVLDVDGFKSVNDHRGHREGDDVLRTVGDLLLRSTRSHVDACYRIGGDEFAIILPALDSQHAGGIRHRIEDLRRHANEVLAPYGVDLSLGVAELDGCETPDRFFHRADQLMYAEKRARKEKSDAIYLQQG